jgi:ATP-dependent 26S proteasome regulatory subunit
MTTKLCPAQQRALDQLLDTLPIGHVFVLGGASGSGKTTALRQLHSQVGGAFLTLKPFLDAMRPRHPLALEETFGQWLTAALDENDLVIFDDLNLLTAVTGGHCGNYPRAGFLETALRGIVDHVLATSKKLIIGCDGCGSAVVGKCSYAFGIGEFKADDYAFLCHTFLGPAFAGRLDFDKIYRFAPRLDAHQLKYACLWLRREEHLDTQRFIDFLLSQHLASNVHLDEVQRVALHDLKGVDDVLESLEANIIVPLENDELATELQLKPKRGVLLVGPPGTGKTTVGRALAHRLKSKFFLLDGTVISGTQFFYSRVHQLFEAAQRNAPSIIFVDDSDAIFESGEELGLYRYLLTMLDGLESASAGRVCVMMTAMDVGHLPPALVRSGRIELWLEMRLPDEAARAAILRPCLASLPPALAEVDVGRLAAATEGFTGADLRRLVDDGKNLLAFDRVRRRPPRPVTEYFLTAVETVRANRERYAEAERRAREQRPRRPVYFDDATVMSGGDGR